MKPVKKDVPRQERRKRTLARLEQYLAGGVKKIKVEEEKFNSKAPVGQRLTKVLVEKTVAFEQKDIDRIQGEISTLRQRLGYGDPLVKMYSNEGA